MPKRNDVQLGRSFWSIFLACVILICAGSVASAGNEILYKHSLQGNQERLPAGWEVVSGSWSINESGLRGENTEGGYIASGIKYTADWTDYSVSFDMKLHSAGSDWRDGPWIGFRHQDMQNAYTLGFYDQGTYLHKASQGKTTGDGKELATSTVVLRDSDWHRIRVTVVDQSIGVFVDGEIILAVWDNGWNETAPLKRGGLVLGARRYQEDDGSTKVLYRNLKVTSESAVPEDVTAEIQRRQRMQKKTEQFRQQQENRSWPDVSKKVLAFYYPWYGTPEHRGDWVGWNGVNRSSKEIENSANYPQSGPYDSQQRKTIKRHVRQAKKAGIDGFIHSWWGQNKTSHATVLKRLLEVADEHDFDVSLYWEKIPGEGEELVRNGISDLVHIVEQVADHPAYLTVRGRPVIFVYGRIMNKVSRPELWMQIVNGARERLDRDFLLIAGRINESNARMFDGIHRYNPLSWANGKYGTALSDAARTHYKRVAELGTRYKKIACATVIPGYKDTQIRNPGVNYPRRDGEVYRTLWEQAIKADPDWVLITSWNEWYEGTDIEPSVEHGDAYLNWTRKFSDNFRSNNR